jgi:hypothetical protein
MLIKIPNVKIRKNSLGRIRHIYTGGRKKEQRERFEEYNCHFQSFFVKASKHASYRNIVE